MKNGLRCGYGKHQYKGPLRTYDGEWANDVKHGDGKLTITDGQITTTFVGTWHDDRILGPCNVSKSLGT